MILAGAGAAAWLLAERPPVEAGVWVLAAVFLSAFGMWLLSGDSDGRAHPPVPPRLRDCCSRWRPGSGSTTWSLPVVLGLLRFESAAWHAFQGSWQTVVLMVLPPGGALLALGTADRDREGRDEARGARRRAASGRSRSSTGRRNSWSAAG